MTQVPWSDNTSFPNANTSSAITLVGLQSGGNVKVPANALTKAIQDAIALAVNFTFAGNVTALNLTGTNTGDQNLSGFMLKANNLSDVASAIAAIDNISKIAAAIPAATTTDIGAATGYSVSITGGTSPITSFGTSAPIGARRVLGFAAAGIILQNNGVMDLITGADITVALGDTCEMLYVGSSQWTMLWYARADGTPLAGGGGSSAPYFVVYTLSGGTL